MNYRRNVTVYLPGASGNAAPWQSFADLGQQVGLSKTPCWHRVRELEQTLAHVKQLHGLLPICCYCKRIRSDQDYWQQLEGYLSEHADVRFSHGICPECLTRAVGEQVGPV